MRKNVIITGSQGNLGSAVTKKFAKEGDHVIGTVEPGKSQDQANNHVAYHEVNVLDADAVDAWVAGVLEEIDTVDALVCLVGGFGMSGLVKSGREDLDKMISLNFFSAFYVVQSFLKRTKSQDSPVHVVFMGAKPAVEKAGSKGVFPYALSKSMVISLADAINAESNELNAFASVMVPSIIDTPPNRESMPDANFDDWVTPESIADKIFFVCSEQGRDLRGTVLKVYGNV